MTRKRCRDKGMCKFGKLEKYKPPKNNDPKRKQKAQKKYYNKTFKGTLRGKEKQWFSQLYAVRKAIKLLQERCKENGGPRCSRIGSIDERHRPTRPPPLMHKPLLPRRCSSPQRLGGEDNPIEARANGQELVPEFNLQAAKTAKYAKIEFYNKRFHVNCLRCYYVSKNMLYNASEDSQMKIPLRHAKKCFLKDEVIIDPFTL